MFDVQLMEMHIFNLIQDYFSIIIIIYDLFNFFIIIIGQCSDRKWSGRKRGTGSGKIRKLGFELGIGADFLVLFLYYYSIY